MNVTLEYVNPADAEPVGAFIISVFNDSVAPYFPEEGREAFRNYVDGLADRLADNSFCIVARHKGALAGAIEIREDHHIALFFVDASLQRRGIGRQLVEQAVRDVRDRFGATQMTVNSSPNSVTAYKSLGFTVQAEQLYQNGIIFVPMKADI